MESSKTNNHEKQKIKEEINEPQQEIVLVDDDLMMNQLVINLQNSIFLSKAQQFQEQEINYEATQVDSDEEGESELGKIMNKFSDKVRKFSNDCQSLSDKST